MGTDENLPRSKHLGSPTAAQGFGQTLNTTVLLADGKFGGCTDTHRAFSPGSNGPLSLLFSVLFVTSPRTITCAPPPTPTPYQLLGKCFIDLSSQLTCLPVARSSGVHPGTHRQLLSFHGQVRPLLMDPLCSAAQPGMPNPHCQPRNQGDQLSRES